MNIPENQIFRVGKGSAPFWQDKHAPLRVPAPSSEPSPANKTAREEKKPHSTKRQTVQAAGWVDLDTDAYINERVQEGQKLFGKKSYTRSRAIREMLQACAQTEMFERNQRVFVPIIQNTMRQMHREFENRYLSINAKIAYQVSILLYLFLKYLSTRVSQSILHQFESDAEKDARSYITNRIPQVEEVKQKILQSMEGK